MSTLALMMPGGLPVLTPKELTSDQEVRWCPGCGDYSILAQMRKAIAPLNSDREKLVFISGIGCSSRFPYYMNTYGFHTIHGRAPAFATGLKVARPDLQVWVITGDGDGLSIGGNHLLHALRRNIDLKIILFNNEIYGLTKGQFSPTTRPGTKTKSTPGGSFDNPLRPLTVALAAEATFVARTVDVHVEHMVETMRRAAAHKGTAFVEVYQNCVIFNEDAFDYASDKAVRADNTLAVEHGKPMIFGKNRDKGIRVKGLGLEVVKLGENGVTEKDLLVHDAKTRRPDPRVPAEPHGPPGFPRSHRRAARREPSDLRRSSRAAE